MLLCAQNMHKICHYVDFNMQNMQNICAKYADICKKCWKHAANMLLYAKICTKSALLRHQHEKHAEHMQKICRNMQKTMQKTCIKYAGYA